MLGALLEALSEVMWKGLALQVGWTAGGLAATAKSHSGSSVLQCGSSL